MCNNHGVATPFFQHTHLSKCRGGALVRLCLRDGGAGSDKASARQVREDLARRVWRVLAGLVLHRGELLVTHDVQGLCAENASGNTTKHTTWAGVSVVWCAACMDTRQRPDREHCM